MHITEINYTPKQIMAAFHDQPFALWLDSADTAHADNRWSFVAVNPIETITYKNGRITHGINGDQILFQCVDPFDFVRQRIEKTNVILSACEESSSAARDPSSHAPQNDIINTIPFTGGAAGYYGYELGRAIEILPKSVKPSKTPDMAIGIYDQVAAHNHASGKTYLITRGDTVKETAFLSAVKNAPATPEYSAPAPDWQDEKSQSEYEGNVAAIIEYIKAGEIYQANMTHRFEAARYEHFHPFAHYLKLRSKSAAPFAGYFNAGSIILSSASPERFIKCTADGEIETKPIKGTMPRSPDSIKDKESAQALQTSDKDRAENIMIVDLLRNDLSKCAATGSVQVPKLCALESFTHVHHLVSTITAYLDQGKDAIDLLKGAFPGGSITGAPKIRAQEIIDELETHERGPYCGALGYIGFDGAMDTNILIRTLVVEEDLLHFHVGGGIVYDSDPAREYQETLDKAAGILASFTSLNEERPTSSGRQSPLLEHPLHFGTRIPNCSEAEAGDAEKEHAA